MVLEEFSDNLDIPLINVGDRKALEEPVTIEEVILTICSLQSSKAVQTNKLRSDLRFSNAIL